MIEHMNVEQFKKSGKVLDIHIPMPPKQMHPNSRTHWRAKLKPKAQQRQEAYLVAKAVTDSGPMWTAARIKATFWLGTRGHKNDSDNLIGWLKASIDGLRDAGILADDDSVTWLPPEQKYGKGAGKERFVVLTVSSQ